MITNHAPQSQVINSTNTIHCVIIVIACKQTSCPNFETFAVVSCTNLCLLIIQMHSFVQESAANGPKTGQLLLMMLSDSSDTNRH